MEVARDPVAHINQVPPNECTLAQNPISADGSEVTSTPDTTTWQPEPEPIASPKLAERVDDLSPSTPSVSVFTLSPSSVATARSPTSTPSRPHISPRLLSPSVSASPSSPATSHRPVRRHLPTHTQQVLNLWRAQPLATFSEAASCLEHLDRLNVVDIFGATAPLLDYRNFLFGANLASLYTMQTTPLRRARSFALPQ